MHDTLVPSLVSKVFAVSVWASTGGDEKLLSNPFVHMSTVPCYPHFLRLPSTLFFCTLVQFPQVQDELAQGVPKTCQEGVTQKG
jgi:hypothetical protein